MPTRSSTRGQQGRVAQLDVSATENKENAKLNGTKTKGKPKSKASKVYCSCRKGDDGSPMILCAECNEWYHFHCISLSERDAEEIESYICPSCHERTGLRTVKDWEGPEAFEAVAQPTPSQPKRRPSVKSPDDSEHEREAEAPDPPPTESEDDDSEDDYVAEKHTSKRNSKRRNRHASVSSSESDAESSTQNLKRLRRVSTGPQDAKETSTRKTSSPITSSVKRKQSVSSQPPAKRQRSESTASGDATRKYCLGKLQEMFVGIFTRYPYLQDKSDEEEVAQELSEPDKQPAELSDEEKQLLEDKAKRFATDLENCMYDIYSEPDKTGKHMAVGKYKERFRMLTFNLGQSDRVVLHKRIASSRISPRELATMSSTELASEETKKTIKELEKEALEHSILKRATLPRAKITHKGLQDIEDVNGTIRVDEREREREEEDQRIARERLARIKPEPLRDPSTGSNPSGSVPPESPVVPQTPTWGAPPPVPMRALHPDEHVTLGRPLANPVFAHGAPDYNAPADGEMNLADLINIDDDPLPETAAVPAHSPSETSADHTPTKTDVVPKTSAETTPPKTPVTAISPFAPKSELSETQPQASFDLSSLWSNQVRPQASQSKDATTQEIQTKDVASEEDSHPEIADENILGEGADDQDFDMFLDGDEDKEESSPVDASAKGQQTPFEALPRVWSGTLTMPLDSLVAQEVPLDARQVGGRLLEHDSLCWQTLFPSREMRIDGRVQVDKSAQFLTQMRLNASKELIAVALTPREGVDSSGFTSLVEYLIAKQRHGLIFPWGNRPKDWCPGRELYIVPLLASEPLPEYMELLDNLKLPESRSTNVLVGIWVLSSGKLAPPPTTSGIAPPVASLERTPVSAISPLQPAFGNAPAPIVPPSSAASSSSALTPEQIQLMLRTLASSGVSPPQPSQAPPPIPLPAAAPIPAPSAWSPPNSAFPPYPPASAYPASQPLSVPVGIPPPQAPYPPGPLPPSSRPYPDHYDQSYDRGGGERGYRGRGSPRARGRGRDRGGRPRDGGWSKDRGRGRGGGYTSPPRDRGRWDEQSRWN